MKKGKQHTVSRFNYPAFMPQGNLFWNGGSITNYEIPSANGNVLDSSIIDAINRQSVTGFDKAYKSMLRKQKLGNLAKNAGNAVIGAVATPIGNMVGNAIDGGMSSGAGSAISDIGGTIGTGLMAVNPLLGAGVTIGSKVLGGVTNRLLGSKMNDKNIADVENNIKNIRSTANNLVSATDNQSLLTNAGNLTMGYDFDNSYIGKDGWWSHKARNKANNLRNQQNVARSYAQHALTTATQNVDKSNDAGVMSSFAAFGGPLDMMINNNGMDATTLGLAYDYLGTKEQQAQAKNTVNNPYFSNFGMGNDTLFADGGCLYHPALFAMGGPEDLLSDVDTRSDTTRRGYNENGARYGASRQNIIGGINPLAEMADVVDRQTSQTRADGPMYNPYLITGDAPALGGPVKAKNALEALQMVKAMKAAKAAKTVKKTTAVKKVLTAEEQAAKAAAISEARKRAAAASVAARKAKLPSTERYQHRFDEARARAAKKEEYRGLAKAAKEADKMTGKTFSPYLKGNQKVYNYNAQRAEDIFHAYGGLLDNNDTLFALGGDLQTNGSDWGGKLVHVDAGSTHENNPYQGVQMGLAPDGSPNLVEESETIDKDQDYVFSNRIKLDKQALKRMRMYAKGGKLTYADASKKLEKESEERPNDPISQSSLKNMLLMLQEEQERQKAEEEAKRVRQAFEALSPEEQAAVMQQIAAQQNGGENGVENGGEEIPVDENGNPIDASAIQQPTQPQEEVPQEEGVVGAYGGNLHKYPNGGAMIKQAILNAIRLKNGQRVLTEDMFNTWANENNVKDFDYNGDWTTALQNDSLKTALTKASPQLAYVMDKGYGIPYNAGDNTVLYSNQNKGNWDKYDIADWVVGDNEGVKADPFMDELQKLAEANENGLNLADHKAFADAVRNTNAYKNTTQWLQNADNAKRYFQALLDDENTPEGARNWINNHVLDSEGNWIGGKYDYNTMLKPVREDGYVGSFWKSAVPATMPDVNRNLLVSKEGSISVIDNDDLSGLTRVGNPYKWTNADGNNTYTFYSMPESANSETPDNGNPDNGKGNDTKIPYKNENLRYIGLLGPALGLGLWGAGVGKPDYGQLESAIDYAYRNSGAKADYKPIGNYMKYQPMDIWYGLNPLYASARATDRAITNNAAPIGTKMAAQLANGYNTTLATGNLYRQGLEYNDAQRQKVFDFNRATDMFNAEAYNKAALTNAELRNRNTQFNAQLAADAAKTRLGMQADWYNSLYGNIGQLTKAAAGIGEDNMSWNQVAGLYNTGALRKYGRDSIYGMNGSKPRGKAKGGKIRRKKGLTF